MEIETTDTITPTESLPSELSIAEHEAAFARDRQPTPPAQTEEPADAESASEADRARDDKGRFAKHHAKSQVATGEDVEEIGKLTKELREKEKQLLALKPDAAGPSPRLINLRRQIRGLEAELAELTPKPAAREAVNQPSAPATPKFTPPVAFTKPAPTDEQFADAADPYAAKIVATMRWEMEKAAHEEAQQRARQEWESREADVARAHRARMDAFVAATPDFHTVASPVMAMDLPPVLLRALVTDDNGPQYVYTLAKRPDLLDELLLLTDGRSVSDTSVAVVQRRLKQHAQAAQSTGSAAVAKPVPTPPKPPNPVRTGPIRTEDEMPGDGLSIAEHERRFGPKGRR